MQLTPLLSLVSLLPTIHAWGSFGHRTVGYLGSKYLTATSLEYVSNILANDQGWDISDAAIWADGSIKRRRPETRQWHYIDAQDFPPTLCYVNYTRDCNKNGSPGCVVSAIKNMTHILLEEGEERSRDGERTKEALMFLIHFLGDIHQPLHTEHLNVGGNTIKVCFDADCSKNLHSVWDTSIPTKYRGLSHNFTHLEEKAAAKLWADEIYEADTTTPSTRTLEKEQNESTDVKDPQSCALQWAVESNGFVCSYVLKPGVEWLELNDLGGSYYEGAALIVEARIAAAGKRLGGWINGIVEELSAERQKLLVQKEL